MKPVVKALLLCAVLIASSSFAQTSWTLIKTNQHDFGASFQTCFLNEQYGFVLPVAGGIFPGFRTTDGGNTWLQCFGNFAGPISDLQWLTPSKVYCVNDEGINPLQLSEDSGKTWKRVSNIGGVTDQLYVKGDSIYVGAGRFSYDAGKTFNILPQKDFRALLNAVTGNKDNGLIYCGDDNGDHGALYTTDYGNTWKTGSDGDDIHMVISMPYTLTYFRATSDPSVKRYTGHPNGRIDSSTVERTTDGGKTWETVLNTTNPDAQPLYLTGGITGSGCTVYVQGTFKHPPGDLTTFPTFQSTDLGKTWRNIGGPANYPSIHISTVARGAILYEGDGHGGLWKFTDSSLLRPATADMTIGKIGTSISADTIYASACDSTLIKLNYGFTACDYVLMDSLSVEGIKEYKVSYRKGRVINENRRDTATVSFFSKIPGTYSIKIHTFVKRDDWVIEDTILKMVLVVRAGPGSLTLHPSDTLDFGSQLFCNLHNDSLHFSLSATGCDDIHITGMYFEPDTGAAGQFVFTPISSDIIGAGKPSKSFTVLFTPKTPGEKRGWIIIESDHGTDTIALKATILSGGISITSSLQHIVFDTITACLGSKDTTILFTNRGCDTLYISDTTGMSAEGLSFLPPFTLPISIAPGKSVPIRFRFSPSISGHYSLHPKLHATEQGLSADIFLNIEGNCFHKPQALASQNYILFDSLKNCTGEADTLISIHNTGCDTLRITQGPGTLSPEFQLLPPFSLPIVIPPDSAVLLHFRFSASAKGNYKTIAEFYAEQDGLLQHIPIALEGNGAEVGGKLSYFPTAFSFPSISICSQDSIFGFITNTGCSPILLNGDYKGDFDFLPWGIGGPGTITLNPNDTFRYKILLRPKTKGAHQGFIWLRSDDHSSVHFDTIPVTTIVLDGTRILNVSVNKLDFGTTTLCAEHDSIVTLKNTGCDTIWITGLDNKGTGFSHSTTTPFFILPGESRSITIHSVLDTTGHITSNVDTLTITSTAQNPIAPLEFVRQIAYPKDYTIRFVLLNPIGKNTDNITMQIIGDSLPIGLTKLDAALSISNTDLLTYVDYASPNTVTITGSAISIAGNPITRNGNIIAELHYKALLTNDSTTSISFSNVIFNDNDIDYKQCIASVQGASDNIFTYDFRCGETTIGKLLRGDLAAKIISIYPNPTSDNVTIDIQSAIEQDIPIHVHDALGRDIITKAVHLIIGRNTIDLDLSDKLNGVYYIVVGQTHGSVVITR